MDTDTRTTAEVKVVIDAQGALQAGTFGWWKVWGGQVDDLRGGDYVFSPDGEEYFVQAVLAPERGTAGILRRRIVVDGEIFTIGRGARVVIAREGTHGTLSAYVR